MTKRNGITIRMNAARNDVTVEFGGSKPHVFDRAAIRLDDQKNGTKHERRLNQEVVDAYCAEHGLNKDKRRNRRERKQQDKRDRANA